MQFTYLGHACFQVTVGGKTLLFDPFISPNELAKHIDITTIAADYILVSHGHADHVADLVAIAQRTKAKVIASWELAEWAQKQGIADVHPMNVGGKWQFSFGEVKSVVAQHSSGRLMVAMVATLWVLLLVPARVIFTTVAILL
jgi:L-ascorbate metabolism protein UlaG (beta-lactamase superfamily)